MNEMRDDVIMADRTKLHHRATGGTLRPWRLTVSAGPSSHQTDDVVVGRSDSNENLAVPRHTRVTTRRGIRIRVWSTPYRSAAVRPDP